MYCGVRSFAPATEGDHHNLAAGPSPTVVGRFRAHGRTDPAPYQMMIWGQELVVRLWSEKMGPYSG